MWLICRAGSDPKKLIPLFYAADGDWHPVEQLDVDLSGCTRLGQPSRGREMEQRKVASAG